MSILFANNAQTSLAAPISNTATSLAVQAGTGSLFPNPSPGDVFYITLTDVATRVNIEIMICTLRVGDILTVVRGQEGTAAQNWLANDIVTNRWTAGQAAAMLQQGQAQTQATNFAVDTGSTNAYQCSLSPSISVPTRGMPIRVLVANTNTGASTFNPGSGSAAVVRRDGTACIGGEIVAGQISEFMWNGTGYDLMNGAAPASAAVTVTQTDNQSFITPAGLQQAFPFNFSTTGYMILPGAVGSRPIWEWTQLSINSGTSNSFTFPVSMTGGLLNCVAQANFLVASGGGGTWGTFGGGPTGVTIVNQTGSNGNFNVMAFGRV